MNLPTTPSLLASLSSALQRRSPLVVMVSLEGCAFCKVARESYLWPLRRQQGLEIVQLDMRDRQSLIDFKGMATTQDEQVRRWKIRLAPTVLFFGRGGEEVAERMNGAYIPDFYGAYLNERLALAVQAVRNG